MKRTIAIVAAIAALTACGEDADSKIPTDRVSHSDDWYFECDGTTGVYITQDDVRSSPGIAVMADHPKCGG